MYSVFTRLDNGELLFVASRDELQQALQLVEEFHANWPHEYVLRDWKGEDVDVMGGSFRDILKQSLVSRTSGNSPRRNISGLCL
jgi:hypothetical protein